VEMRMPNPKKRVMKEMKMKTERRERKEKQRN